MTRVILASSGSGGHLFPSISLAKALKEKEPSMDILFVGSQKKLERKIVEGHGWKFSGIPASGMPFGFSLNYPVAIFNFFLSVGRALKLLKEFRPNVVVGFGGYVSA
ncbi:MAG: glycosyltransferase, partial [Candidatus Omnitrophica bacterium]|nr:glycosyltransferase [Candidatus Omnitrophota bacterium]